MRKPKMIRVKAGADLIVSIPQAITGRHYLLTGDTELDLPMGSFVRRRMRKGELVEVSAAKPAKVAKKKTVEANARFDSKPALTEDKTK